MFALGLAILAGICAAPRTAFAGESESETAAQRCFDGMAVLTKLKRDGYSIAALGFVQAGRSLIEVWTMPDGRFLIVSFEGETSRVCIETAGAGWQSYIKPE